MVQKLKAHSIANATFQRRRRHAQLCHPQLAPNRDMPNRLTNLRQRAKVVVLRHLLLITHFLASFQWADPDFRECFAFDLRQLH